MTGLRRAAQHQNDSDLLSIQGTSTAHRDTTMTKQNNAATRPFPWQQPLTGQQALDRVHADVHQLLDNLTEHDHAGHYGGSISVENTAALTEAAAAAAIVEFDGALILDRHANAYDLTDLPDCGWAAVVRAALPEGVVELSLKVNPHDASPTLSHRITEIQTNGTPGRATERFNFIFQAALQPAIAKMHAVRI